MIDDLKTDLLQVALVQFDIAWKNAPINLEKIDKLIENVDADLIVLALV